MKILLVKPYQLTNEVQPPLGLGYLASAIRKKHDVKILDCIKENYKFKDFIRYIKNNKFDVIGFQCYTIDMNTIKKYSKIVKKLHSKIITLIGGPQPTLSPKQTMRYLPNIDFCFVGEGEASFPKLLDSLKTRKFNKIDNLAYRKGNKIIINKRNFIENLDDYNPSWDMHDIKNYPTAPHGAFLKNSPSMPIIVSRGCPFDCNYCGASKISGKKLRYHSVDFIINQIKLLVDEYGIKEIHIEDDNFTVNKNYVMEFCNKLIKENIKISWALINGARIETMDDEMISLMKESGCYYIGIGVESGVDKIRKSMGKHQKAGFIKEKIDLLNKYGIDVCAYFILGYPGETKEDIEETIKFACSLDILRAGFSAFKPFPGTRTYNELVKEQKFNKINYNAFSLDKIAYSPDGINFKELKKLRRKAFFKFYLRTKIIYNMLIRINNWQNFKFILVRMYRWLS